ncbi:MAG: hypothetical protein CMJ76_02520 [Planctomycetaceae bacterium]|nr:hypothetical protein [Planctomycetaceae bacterium]|tara:strand:+ start:882 stop:1475 length:594 start_codon:yes stop_codon:yes gene_type:complete
MELAAGKAEDIFRSLNRELWVVTAADSEHRGGLLATWVSQASLDPARPVILAGLAPNHYTTELVRNSGQLVVHLLNSDQSDVAWNFCRDSGRERDKLASCELETTFPDIPVLASCHSFLLGRVFACVETGERTYFWADIEQAEKYSSSAPLCEQQFLQWCDEDKKNVLKSDKLTDVQLQRDLESNFRQSIPDWLRFG